MKCRLSARRSVPPTNGGRDCPSRGGHRLGQTTAAIAVGGALLVPVVALGPPTAQASPPLADSTRANALAAMHGEAFAYAKYLAYASQAQQAGRSPAAQAFTDAAQVELTDHFFKQAELIGFGGDIAANLRDAITGETDEATSMYPGYARQATADGDPAAAQLFNEIAADETIHLRDFTTALNIITTQGPAAAVPTGAATSPEPVTAGPARSSGATLDNERAALQGEAFAYAKYMRYADQARRAGNPTAAQLFTNTANVELNEHFPAVAALAGLVQSDTNANLADAITGEQHEADVMYPDYARQADEAGNQQAAELFREIAGDERAHQQAFQQAMTAG